MIVIVVSFAFCMLALAADLGSERLRSRWAARRCRSLEGRLMSGDLSGAQFRAEIERLASEDDLRRPLAVPPR